LNVGISGARAFSGTLTGAGEGVLVEPVGPADWPVAAPLAVPVTAKPVEQTALDLD
jgi:hypothetical protein